MKFPGNCLLVALVAWALHPRSTRIRLTLNKKRRVHVTWERGGERFEFYTPGASQHGYLRNALRIGEIRKIEKATPASAAPAAPFVPPREYTHKEVVLPSGRFAAMSKILWVDVIASHDSNALLMWSKLATRCVSIDGAPLEQDQLLSIEASEFFPICAMLQTEAEQVVRFANGVR